MCATTVALTGPITAATALSLATDFRQPQQLTITLGRIGYKKKGVGGGGRVFAQAGFEGGPEMFDGVEVG